MKADSFEVPRMVMVSLLAQISCLQMYEAGTGNRGKSSKQTNLRKMQYLNLSGKPVSGRTTMAICTILACMNR